MASAARVPRIAVIAILPALLLATSMGDAHADEPSSPAPVVTKAKDPVPDYDGRKPAATTPGEVALWVPRILLSPLYLLSEFVIRKPIGALVTAAERANVPRALYDFFAFGTDHKAGIAPAVFIEFGFRPSVGLVGFWDDAFFKGNDFRATASTWGTDWLAGGIAEKIHFHKTDSITFAVGAVKRPDHAFFGIGPSSLFQNRSRYAEDAFDTSAALDVYVWRSSHVTTDLGVRRVHVGEGYFGDNPGLEQAVAAGAYPVPYGFGQTYVDAHEGVHAVFDTRKKDDPGTGLRLALDGVQGSDVEHSPGSGWVRYGATAGAFYDLHGWDDRRGRVISLSATALFADPLGTSPIPFTELVTLGGYGPMRGFYPGRLVDRSAAVATARYRWPVATSIDGTLEAAVGNVFGEHLEGFRPELLRVASAIGIESIGSPNGSFELLVGIGTETFAQGAQIEAVRLLVGTNHGF